MNTDIRAVRVQIPSAVPCSHTISLRHSQSVSSRRLHNFLIPSQNLTAQGLGGRNCDSNFSNVLSSDIPSTNVLNIHNSYSATNQNLRNVTSELNSQEEQQPPSYTNALEC